MTRGVVLTILLAVSAQAVTVSESANGIALSVSEAGGYIITTQDPAWTFAGYVGQRLEDLQSVSSQDRLGAYDEIRFRFSTGVARHGAIRGYRQKRIVVFTLQFLESGDNSEPFPHLTTVPRDLYRLTFDGGFGGYSFGSSRTEGPLVEFDSGANAFILSAASNFMTTMTVIGDNQEIAAGVDTRITTLPAGFTNTTILVVEKGINQVFETWGRALTDLQGKVRPANDADVTLSHLGYWTDNGAHYYYHFEHPTGYEATLLAIRDEFQRKGIPLGYLQLDSWFYPKGPHAEWYDGHDGIYQYVAAPELFPNGLKAYQAQLGIPLVTHARWIDPSSPYRKQYLFSGDVAVDQRYWDSVMSYLHDAGVTTYEQDWLSYRASTDFNLDDPGAFLDAMATSAARNGMTLQYCMPTARHFLQSSKYSNLTTVRTSPDRFQRSRWDRFLYGSRLAGALGIWPWCDVFMSSEADSLLLAALSGGPVGVGDPIGAVNAANLLRAVRKDGVIVKPNAPLVPMDQSFINDAQGGQAPMLAATYTDLGDLKAAYVFAYPRGSPLPISFQPKSLGFDGLVYIYNYLAHTGRLMNSAELFIDETLDAYAYYIVTPIGRSGIGLLGDADQLVSLGRQRIHSVIDDGVLEVAVTFAQGESDCVLHGYSPSAPKVTAKAGAAGVPSYDPATRLFRVSLLPGNDGSAVVDIAPGTH